MPARIKDFRGHKYGKLTIDRWLRGQGSGKHAVWMAKCDCGNEREVVAHEVARGNISTCGKCEPLPNLKSQQRSRGNSLERAHELLFRREYAKYVKKAMTRGEIVEISRSQFDDIVNKDCIYCNTRPPFQKDPYHMHTNLVDRVDVEKGHTLDNLVPCCSECSRMKKNFTTPDFLNHMLKIYNHLSKYSK